MSGHYFISYSRLEEGTQFALRLTDELEARPPSYRMFVDVRAMQPGQDWDRQLVEAIQTCAGMLFVMTDDSVRDESGCKAEWVAALRYKKPIIPLRLSPRAELPFRLGSRQFIDFSDRFETGLAQLRQHLSWRVSPAGVLQDLRERRADAEYELPRADPAQRGRIRREIEELRARIEKQQQVVDSPRAVAEQTDARIGAAIERERQPERTVVAPAQAKFVNPPPLTAPPYFQDRHVETGMIGDFLRADGLRMMSVVGRGGVGKTAMVCRLLKALEGGRLPDELGELAVDGIVYLSPLGAHPVDFAHLFPDVCRLLPQDVADPLLERFHDPQETPAALMRLLLERFAGGRWVLLLDNFEDVVDADGVGLTDSALEEALLTVLRAPQHGVKVILTTRVAPRDVLLEQPGAQRRLNLDEGLPSPFAEEVLRAMDPDGSLGIRDAPAALLAQARERTRGFPRALEALAAILAADRDTTLPELLAATESLPENVVEALVGEAFSRLDALAQQVMQALAIYPGPVPPVAIDYLLQPLEPAIDSAPVLGRLVNMQFVRRDAGRYYLHQVDRDYALERVAVGEPSDRYADAPPFSQYALRERAATYFQQTRTARETWKTLDDLAPQLAEFELRCQTGDYDTAAQVLLDISFENLQLWGHIRLARDLHERVHDHLSDPQTKSGNLLNLGSAYHRLGEVRRAIEFYEQALAIDREIGDRGGEGSDLGNIGLGYVDLGEVRRAIEFHEQALTIHREIGDRGGEGADLLNLGSAYHRLGEVRRAIEFYEQALTIHREIGDRLGEGTALGNISLAYVDLGEVRRGIELHEQALTIHRETGDRGGEALGLIDLAAIYTDAEDLPRAIRCGEHAVGIADEIGLARGSSEGRVQLATTYLYAGEYDLARATAHAARSYDYAPASDNVALVLGIALTRQGRVDAARAAFHDALNAAESLLARTPDTHDELDSRALALCGLALLEDPVRVSAAIEAFRAARAITSAKGIVARVLRLLDALAISDQAGILAAVRPVAAGEP
jgi:tetratricopeptide (TPR) repeat protein